MMRDGVIGGAIESARFSGPQEVEIFSAENWWKRPGEEVLSVCPERFRSLSLPRMNNRPAARVNKSISRRRCSLSSAVRRSRWYAGTDSLEPFHRSRRSRDQGVGSGGVSFLVAWRTVRNSYQSAFRMPTEAASPRPRNQVKYHMDVSSVQYAEAPAVSMLFAVTFPRRTR